MGASKDNKDKSSEEDEIPEGNTADNKVSDREDRDIQYGYSTDKEDEASKDEEDNTLGEITDITIDDDASEEKNADNEPFKVSTKEAKAQEKFTKEGGASEGSTQKEDEHTKEEMDSYENNKLDPEEKKASEEK